MAKECSRAERYRRSLGVVCPPPQGRGSWEGCAVGCQLLRTVLPAACAAPRAWCTAAEAPPGSWAGQLGRSPSTAPAAPGSRAACRPARAASARRTPGTAPADAGSRLKRYQTTEVVPNICAMQGDLWPETARTGPGSCGKARFCQVQPFAVAPSTGTQRSRPPRDGRMLLGLFRQRDFAAANEQGGLEGWPPGAS